jgi:MFS family permease
MKNYWFFFVAALFSLTGVNFYAYTQGWYLLALTGEKLSVGISWSILFLPSLFFLPVMGKMLDTLPLKKVLICFEIAKLGVLASFVLVSQFVESKWIVYLFTSLFGLSFAPFYPSLYVVLKKLTPKSTETKYSHLFEISIQISSIVAVLSAGYLYQSLGFFNLVGLGCACIFISIFFLATIRFPAIGTKVPVSSIFKGYSETWSIAKSIFSNSTLSARQILFGILHQFPQNIVLVGNIPLILFVYEVMKKGPVEFGIMDAIYGVSAMGVSFVWARQHAGSQTKIAFMLSLLGAGLSLCLMSIISVELIWPYLATAILASMLTSSKILSRAAVVRMIPADKMGVMSTSFQTFSYISLITMFFAFSFLSSIYSARIIYGLLGVLLLLFSCGAYFLYVPSMIHGDGKV